MPAEPAGAGQADAAAPATVACDVCGASVAAPPPVTWSLSRDGRRASHICGDCTRRHLRAMEAQLEQEHW